MQNLLAKPLFHSKFVLTILGFTFLAQQQSVFAQTNPSPIPLPPPPSRPNVPSAAPGNRQVNSPLPTDLQRYVPQPGNSPTGFPRIGDSFNPPTSSNTNPSPLSTFRSNLPQTNSQGNTPNSFQSFPQPTIGGFNPQGLSITQPQQFGYPNQFNNGFSFGSTPQDYSYPDYTFNGSLSPNGGGFNRFVDLGQQWLPVLQSGLNGGGFNSILNSAAPRVQSILGRQFGLSSRNMDLIQSGLPIAQQLLGGDFRGALSGALPLVSNFLPQNVGNVLGAVGPLASQLMSGRFSASGLLSAGSGLLQLFGRNNQMLGNISGILGGLGGLFGGGGSNGTGVSVAQTLLPVLQFGGAQTQITNAITGGSNQGMTNSILSQTGTVLCRYNQSGCVTSNPVAYQSLYGSSAGQMGFANPNQVRGQIADLSRRGVLPDAFASRNTSEQNSYYMGNWSDRELSRTRTESVLSIEAQDVKQKAITASNQVAAQLLQLGDQCSQSSQSSQELIRCQLQPVATLPTLLSSQLELGHSQQVDNAFAQIILGNISSAIDGDSRVRVMEFTATANRLARDTTLNIMPKPRK
jgi:hypothetical protein